MMRDPEYDGGGGDEFSAPYSVLPAKLSFFGAGGVPIDPSTTRIHDDTFFSVRYWLSLLNFDTNACGSWHGVIFLSLLYRTP